MARQAKIVEALVLQGGGALGAFELGAARVLYQEAAFAPGLIAGVSIGAVTAVLLARPRGGEALAALAAFWREVTASQILAPWAAVIGNPRLFTPRADWWAAAGWTSLYSTAPLRETLAGLVDEAALADGAARPRLLLTATRIDTGEITAFDSAEGGLTLDHVLASGALPPGFPMVRLNGAAFWDGGLFDNTPLGAVLARMDRSPGPGSGRRIAVMDLFPNPGPVPADMAEVAERVLNLMFANKTASDLKLLRRFNAIAALLDLIRADPRWADLARTETFAAADRGYIETPDILTISRASPARAGDIADFSAAAIGARIAEGERAARAALAAVSPPAAPA